MNDNKHGKFITLEGIEGVGKTTNLRFLVEYLHEQGIPVLATREPGGTPLADEIRHFLLSHYEEKIHPDTELLLMFAARAQHVNRIIKPALEAGKWVVCDRFTDASYAYQGAGRGIEAERIAALENWTLGNLRPHLTLLLNAPLDIALERVRQRKQLDRIESEATDFFARVQNCYLERATAEPARIHIVDTHRDLSEIQLDIQQSIEKLITAHN